ncbi:AraC family transcriptional regulator [Pedobacter psychrodurus]|uniref:AraC family transcriptional regulator n=1 Tax=Pedobacter psychrodurus TaxID=2530456 RepID=A0A4R0PZT1_9SPHI|nr:helix-turn-helix domain-containing protein [Pedobacter psychrodurus]TCD28780.1 AraC family transcriptional regulator [Pedobacter psychrodurus]
MHLSEHKPAPILTPYVKCYRIIDFEFSHNNPIPPKAYTPRPEHCLQFFPSPTKIEYPTRKDFIKPKNALLFGQHTVVNMRTVYKKFLSLQIVFKPGALYSLLGIPAVELTNTSIDAELVLGKEIEEINDQLFNACTHNEMLSIADRYIIQKLEGIKNRPNRIDLVAEKMLTFDQPLDYYVANGFLSQRQFNRRFLDSVGISPKAFLKVARFDYAYRLKNVTPSRSWFNLAIDCGYYDYQHLSKDYKTFTGFSPSDFFAMDSPERQLGTEEIY